MYYIGFLILGIVLAYFNFLSIQEVILFVILGELLDIENKIKQWNK